ncbi:MAG: 4-(cytidine 5'-diphospho)-2-C-methyl-D-erythritol kinase [Deltaproteobacteria bacterium]|nr:4-(cytidine 5'-diphospho)-2-C-methyl-D-erythritol kinase [Deltaproteobacteria bacterium]
MLHRVLSPAKINLFLKVLKKREDGYHDIVSIMQPISLYDEIILKIEKGKGISVECNNKSIPCDKTNLVYRAAEVFFRSARIKRNLSIKIKKNIPVAAGLGGGSSNAAAALKALNEITSVCLSQEKLMEMAAGLGSDVPFFILGKPCLASGRGEILEPVNLPQFWYILINPGFPVSTQWAYQNLNLTKMEEDISIAILKVSAACRAGRWDNPAALQGVLINDLEEATIRKHPEIQEIKTLLIDFGATGALMSGSGPTVFGIFPDKDRAQKTFKRIKKDQRFKNMAVFVAQGLKL